MAFDTTKAYTVKGYSGIAFRFHSWPVVWDPYLSIMQDDEGNEWTEDCGDGEWVEREDDDKANFVMVGDDKKFLLSLANVTPISDTAFCHSCGQIGCRCNVPDED
jgi:hypothetical protein